MALDEEARLVRDAAAGGRDAFAELVRRHQGRVRRLCLGLLRDPARADDAAAEVFLKAFSALERFEGRSSFSTWLHRIAVHHCLDLFRREARQETQPLEERIDRPGEPAVPDPSARLEDADLAARLLAALPEEQRLALLLREAQGLSYAEVAEVLGTSLDSVKARLRRARAALAQGLRHFSGPGDV